MKLRNLLLGAALSLVLAACGGGGGSPGTTSNSSGGTSSTSTTSTTTSSTSATGGSAGANANATVATIVISGNATSMLADGVSSVTFSIAALDSGNALVSNAVINLSATNNTILNPGSIITSAGGGLRAKLYANPSDKSSRVSSLTASCVGCSATPVTVQVSISGASIALSSAASSLVVGGVGTLLSATVNDVSGQPISGVPVSFSSTDASILSVSSASATTNSLGVASITASGISAGSASVNVNALGNARSQAYTAAALGGTLAFTTPGSNATGNSGVAQAISLAAPGASQVTVASSICCFSNSASSQILSVSGGVASATLTPNQAGTVVLNATDNLSRNAAVNIAVTPAVALANKILINASRTTLPVAASGNQSSVLVTAQAIYSSGGTDQPVANVPLVFSLAGGPAAGEFLTPVLASTNSAGYATATFFAGSAVSISNGITISAQISGSSVRTGLSPSNNSLLMTIGGQALSVAFGPASVLQASSDNTLYIQAYSVQVTDANNNPVSGAVVTLRMRPIAFSTGGACSVTATYCSEDANGNGSLDPGEDGTRTSLPSNLSSTSCPGAAVGGTPNLDGLLTPQNSDGGSVPSTVTTDLTGIAPFNVTYLKGQAFWTVNKLTATVSSSGTESSKSTIFRLAATTTDVGPPCSLPNSPYQF